jgi:hypothetical protein
MHTYLVVARKPSRRLPGHLQELLDSDDPGALWFEPESHVVWSNETGALHFAGWQAGSTLLGIGSHWQITPGGVAAFSGRPFPIEGEWDREESWAVQLARRFEQVPLAESRENFRGIFTLVSLPLQAGGAIASDPLGLGLVFFAATDDFAVFSNRAAVCAQAIAPPSGLPARDPVAAGWLAYCGYILGNATAFEGVRALPQGAWVELDPSGGSTVREPAGAPWLFGSSGYIPKSDELIELVHDDIAAALRSAVAVPGPHTADITGGKDSRLILSLLVAEGLADEVEFQTIGDPTHPDAQVALEAADRLGLRHRTHPALPLGETSFEEQIRVHTFQTSGMLGASDLIGRSFPMEHLHISGACGEALRTNYPAYRDIRDEEHMLGAFRAGMHFDTLGLIKPDLRAQYDQWAADAFLAMPWDVDEPLDLIDVFYLRQRLRRWLGAEQEMNFSNRVFPLYSPAGVRAAFAIGASKRRDEFIHLELMRRYGGDLLDLPLASGRWAGEQRGQTPRTGEAEAAKKAREHDQAERRKWQAHALRENKAVFRKLLPSDPAHPVFALFDRAAILSAIYRADRLTLHGRIQLYGAITAAIWLGAEESAWRVRVEPAA